MKKPVFFVHPLFFFLLLVFVLIGMSCQNEIKDYKESKTNVSIFPDYQGVTIPSNIAPLNFKISEKADQYFIRVQGQEGTSIKLYCKDGLVLIPEKKWKNLLQFNKGKTISLDIFLKRDNQWTKYPTIRDTISSEPIDPYLVYRLIEPGFETWNKMGIYQRCLENFEETPIMVNDMSDGNCMNCHSFCMNNHATMLFHVRAKHGGTVLLRNGVLTKVDTKTDSTLSAGVYPAWHPGGRYVAFSVNRIVQSFHAVPKRKIEVVDTLADIILYDAEKNRVIKNPGMASADRYETFPTWSPDGKYLYFCSAKFRLYKDFQDVKFDLLRMAYDATKEAFGQTDTVISAAKNNFSVSFPRISPDGKYLMFTRTNYGNFTIWHDDADLYQLNLLTGETTKPIINSEKSESYHSWSSTGHWMVFSSRRVNGQYTMPFFTFVDKMGVAHKPFLLPQKSPEFYDNFLKSFNVPELVSAKVELDPRKLEKVIKSEAKKASFDKKS